MSEESRDWAGTLEGAIVRIQGRTARSLRKHCFNGHLPDQRACEPRVYEYEHELKVDKTATRPENGVMKPNKVMKETYSD